MENGEINLARRKKKEKKEKYLFLPKKYTHIYHRLTMNDAENEGNRVY